jgi:hypothetical protein
MTLRCRALVAGAAVALVAAPLSLAVIAAPAQADQVPGQADATTTVTVIDSATSAPIPGASVTAMVTRPFGGATNAAGEYAVPTDVLPADLFVAAPGYSTSLITMAAQGSHIIPLTSNTGLAQQPVYGFPVYNAVMAADRVAPGVFYAQSAFGTTVWRTTDSGVTWGPVTTEAMDSESGLRGRTQYTGRVLATSGAAGEIAVVSAVPGEYGYDCPQVSVSRNYGATWVSVPFAPSASPSGCPFGAPELMWGAGGGESVLVLRMSNSTDIFIADMTSTAPTLTATHGYSGPVTGEWSSFRPNDLIAVAADSGGAFAVTTNTPDSSTNFTSELLVYPLGATGPESPTAVALNGTIEVAAGTFPFVIGGEGNSVIALGDGGFNDAAGSDVLAIAARSTSGSWSEARATVVDTGNNPLTGTGCYAHEVTLAPVGNAAGGIRGLAPGCAFTAEPSGEDSLTVTVGESSHGLRPAYSADYGSCESCNDVLSLNFGGGSRGVQRFTGRAASAPFAPSGPVDATEGIRDTIVAATAPGPDGSTLVALTEDGGRQVVAVKSDGTTSHFLRYQGGTDVDHWTGASGTWTAVSAERANPIIAANWTPASGADDQFGASSSGYTLSDSIAISPTPYGAYITSLKGVDGADQLFFGTFGGTGTSIGGGLYGGKVFFADIVPARQGSPNTLDMTELQWPEADLSETRHAARVTDLAYCPAGSDESVSDTLFVSTGYLNWAPGGLYIARGVRARLDAGQTVTLDRVLGINDARENVVVPQVDVDCSSGFAATVQPSTGFGDQADAVVSDDGFDQSMVEVDLPDINPNQEGTQNLEVTNVAVDPSGTGALLIGGDSTQEQGFIFAVDYPLNAPIEQAQPAVAEAFNPQESKLEVDLTDLTFTPDTQAPPPVQQSFRAARSKPAPAPVAILAQPEPERLGALGSASGSFGLSGVMPVAPDTPVATAPNPPTNVIADPGDASIAVTWTASAVKLGAPVTRYVATASGGGSCEATGASATSCTITGLTNGSTYTVTMRAYSGGAASESALAREAVVPRGVPTLAVSTSAPGTLRVQVTPSTPAVSATWSVTWQRRIGPEWSTVGAPTTANSSGVATFTYTQSGAYRATVTETTAYTSAISSGVTTPNAPTGVQAVAGDGRLTVSWTAPTAVEGAAVTGYTAVATPGGATCAASTTTCAITGLANGTPYTVQVYATSSGVHSMLSTASAAATPRATPAVVLSGPSAGVLRVTMSPARPTPSSTWTVTLQRQSGTTWSDARTGVAIPANGRVDLTYLGSGTYRVVVPQTSAYTTVTSVPQAYTAAQATVKLSVVNKNSLLVDVGPDSAGPTWRVVIERQVGTTWRAWKTVTAAGPKKTATATGAPKGTYRAVLANANNYLGATTSTVTVR